MRSISIRFINSLYDHSLAILPSHNDVIRGHAKWRFVAAQERVSCAFVGMIEARKVGLTGAVEGHQDPDSWQDEHQPRGRNDGRTDIMTRFLTTTAIALLLGLAPAYAETQAPVTTSNTSPALPSAQPAASGQATPATLQSPGTPNLSVPDQSADGQAAAPTAESSPFLVKQERSDLLVGNLIGETVTTPNNESIGEITDLVTDKHGKVIAVLIGAGGILGIGQKDIAVRFQDIEVSRDGNNDLRVTANITKEMIAQAPDYQTLDEQQIIMGEKSDREDSSQ
jgi:hypothetical protein